MGLRKTKIICTIGPATRTVERIETMLRVGMNVARINFSHETREQHGKTIAMIRRAEEQSGIPVAIMLDTKGPEIRTGAVPAGTTVELRPGATVTLVTTPMIAVVDPTGEVRLSVSYADLPRIVKPNDHIYIADGLVDLRVVRAGEGEIVTVVESGGGIGSHKNVNIPGVSLPMPAISERDAIDIRFGLEHGVDFIAASFTRSASDVLEIRQLIEEGSAEAGRVIAKIENKQGVDHIDEIIEVADGVMIARGDLGIQLPMEQIPLVQKRIINACNRLGTPVVTATQMLESMVSNSRPTRAEMTDVANAIFDGTDAVMLSGETAAGRYPIESIKALDRIARAVERSAEFVAQNDRLLTRSDSVICSSDAVARSACLLARDVAASCIVVPTVRGNGPRLIARYRSEYPIIAAVARRTVIRQLLLYWGVIPLQTPEVESTAEMLENAMNLAKKHGYVRRQGWVVTVAGIPLRSPITLNTMSAQYIGKVLRRGLRAYGERTTGVVVIRRGAQGGVGGEGEGDSIDPQSILVVEQLTADYTNILSGVRGVISERLGTLTPQQVRMQNKDIVIIEEMEGACDFFHEGQQIHMNGPEKTVYEQ